MKKRKKKTKKKNHFYYPKITAIFIYLYFYVFWIICRETMCMVIFLIKVRLVTYFSPLHICESISISIKIHLHNLMVVWLY